MASQRGSVVIGWDRLVVVQFARRSATMGESAEWFCRRLGYPGIMNTHRANKVGESCVRAAPLGLG